VSRTPLLVPRPLRKLAPVAEVLRPAPYQRTIARTTANIAFHAGSTTFVTMGERKSG
jgi:hypothetical protein